MEKQAVGQWTVGGRVLKRGNIDVVFYARTHTQSQSSFQKSPCPQCQTAIIPSLSTMSLIWSPCAWNWRWLHQRENDLTSHHWVFPRDQRPCDAIELDRAGDTYTLYSFWSKHRRSTRRSVTTLLPFSRIPRRSKAPAVRSRSHLFPVQFLRERMLPPLQTMRS